MGNKNSFNDLSQLKNLLPDDYKSEMPEEKSNKEGLNMNNSHVKNIPENRKAKAPYNFVPLNEKVVPAPEICDFDLFNKDRYSGYFDITLTNLYPLYIRDAKRTTEINKESREISRFFSVGGEPRIPGSSLRGLIRSYLEIFSFSKFTSFNDDQLYFRDFTRKPLQKVYSDYGLVTRDGEKLQYNMKCGFLYKDGFDYYIKDCGNPKKVLIENAEKLIRSSDQKLDKKRWGFYKLKRVESTENSVTSSSSSNAKFEEDSNFIRTIVVTGGFNKKKYWLINEPVINEKIIKIDSKDIFDYKNDKLRNLGKFDKWVPNLLEISKSEKVPVFYIEWKDSNNENRISFGHTGMFRLPYKLRIGDHVPAILKDENINDFAENIFGDNQKIAGRIYFEDSFLVESKEDAFEDEHECKTLLGPKPTSFQLYLVQSNCEQNQLNHYNSNKATIRGYKQYWHKNSNWRISSDDEYNENITTRIKPIKGGKSFKGKIRFENLTKQELGALVFTLNLPEGSGYKLGMGKSLGLGSILISSNLFIYNRKKRYSEIMEGFTKGKNNLDKEAFVKSFEDYILDKLGLSKKYKSIKEIDRIKEFLVMLNVFNSRKRENLDYMGFIRERLVLPKPSEVN